MQVTGLLEHFRKLTFLIFTVLLSINFDVKAQVYPDRTVHGLLKSGIDLVVKQDYDDAKKIFLGLDKIRQDIPLGKIYLAALSIARSYDYAEPFDDARITKYLSDAKKISQRLLDKDKNNIWYNYFYAMSEGYIAYYAALQEKWIDAFSGGLNAVAAFEYCMKLDKNFYESKIAIGSYKFWKSKKIEFLNWLPFIDDEKETGINYLEDAVTHSGYNSHVAVNSLIWIYIEQSRFNDAVQVAQSALKKYPDSRVFKWGLARAYEEIDPGKSIKLYKEILLSYPASLKTNKINEITLKHLIAQQMVKLKMNAEALTLCAEILSENNLSEYEKSKLNDRLERVAKLKRELSK